MSELNLAEVQKDEVCQVLALFHCQFFLFVDSSSVNHQHRHFNWKSKTIKKFTWSENLLGRIEEIVRSSVILKGNNAHGGVYYIKSF